MTQRTQSTLRRLLGLVGQYAGRQELMVLAGLALLWSGLRIWSPAAALAIPGAIVVWMALPSRPPFIGGKE